MNAFIQQEYIQLIKSDSTDISEYIYIFLKDHMMLKSGVMAAETFEGR